MTIKKIIITAALLLSASPAAMAQSAWTTGTASDRARAGYEVPNAGGFYAYAPRELSRDTSGRAAYAMVPHFRDGTPRSIDDPALTGGGDPGYNDSLRHDW